MRTRPAITMILVAALVNSFTVAAGAPPASESGGTGDDTRESASLGFVTEPEKRVPVVYDVDVVVVGGGTGAVEAAVAAADAGAKVFLAAPHPYLGDDVTATLRLWLEEGEEPDSPLARRVFTDPAVGASQPDPNRIPFSYEADVPSAAKHKDTDPPRLLTDGRWTDAPSQSV